MISLLDPRAWLFVLALLAGAYGVGRWHQQRADTLARSAADGELNAVLLADQRRQAERAIDASAGYQADRAALLTRLRKTKGDLDAVLRRPPARCPATVGDAIVPGALGVRLNDIAHSEAAAPAR